LTLKATMLSDAQLKLAGFVELTPVIPLRAGEHRRAIWAKTALRDLVAGKITPESGFPCLEFDLFVGRYCKGYIVSATRDQKKKSDFKWLQGHDQVWVVALRNPRPGWRIFGRFAGKNRFVALGVFIRGDLGNLDNYSIEASKIPLEWDALFPNVPAHEGAAFQDYLGEPVRDDDE
jgi:hypothetical protein